MKSRFTLALVLSFAGGVLLTAAIGGALGVFDRGPTEQDVSDARQRGREEATAEVESRKVGTLDEQNEIGFQRGREASEWLSLDRLPNPDGWFAGVAAGRKQLDELADEAFLAGYEMGQQQGRDEALGFLRFAGEGRPPSIDAVGPPSEDEQ